MPGRHVTRQQVRLVMQSRRQLPQRVAAARTGFSERAARRVETDRHFPSREIGDRLRRKYPDLFAGLWDDPGRRSQLSLGGICKPSIYQ